MIRIPSLRRRARGPQAAALTLGLAGLPSGHAVAADFVGLYAGGAIGQSKVTASAPVFAGSDFKENHSAFKVMVGLRPLSPVGAEIEYVDLGHPRGSVKLPASAGPVTVASSRPVPCQLIALVRFSVSTTSGNSGPMTYAFSGSSDSGPLTK